MTDLIFIQKSDEIIAVGTGPFKKKASVEPTTPCFYVNNFFLDEPTPWIVPSEFFEITVTEFRNRFLSPDMVAMGNIEWQHPEDLKFRKFFQKIKRIIEEGILEKIVPVQFEYGKIPDQWETKILETFTHRFIRYLSTGLSLFGYKEGEIGFCGLTPELIFQQKNAKILTAALAGTAASSFGDRSIKNPKDAREHQIVVDDIYSQLSPFGKVRISETIPYWNGSLIHLKAFLEVQSTKEVPFDELVHAIHPTAAVGVFPRTKNANAILKSSDIKWSRGYFASPFGIHYPDGMGLCIAAIRSVFWNGNEARLGAGCGVIEESDVELELIELSLKRKSIKEKIAT